MFCYLPLLPTPTKNVNVEPSHQSATKVTQWVYTKPYSHMRETVLMKA